ncbi:266_t:CDS:2 [Ambispora gerdemannii]|uniref:266_t:CDS:1 n=1 Tax=Ambispora gerdemannii TaxID=144530 RepID=A0A9N9AQR1_9GLOM|nr:266_t:CDS:2 [Ambispora gerdemannii]
MFLFSLICLYLIFYIPTINAQSSFAPNSLTKAEHGILVDDKIIFFDSADFGIINNTNAFALDLSVNWTTSTPAFTKIDNISNGPTFNYAAFSAFETSNRTLIYAFGGLIPAKVNNWDVGNIVDDFYEINMASYTISLVQSGSILPKPRCNANSIFDDKGNLYIWGGETATTDQAMYIFDTVNSTWNSILPATSYVPAQRSGYSVTFRDNKIYYVGGVFAKSPDRNCVDIREIIIYDTLNQNNPWDLKKATNNTYISNRYSHAAVLAPNNQSIILYGGSKSNASGIPDDYLITLDLRTFEFSEIIAKNKPSINDNAGWPTPQLLDLGFEGQ